MAVLTREETGPLTALGGPARPGWGRHLPFGVLVVLATGLRVVAMIAYDGILWFPDGHSYLTVAVHPLPYPARPMGYGFFLYLLEPFHSLAFVAAVQHVLGIAAGIVVYVVLRRFRAPGWVATLCAAPVLLDAYQLQLEHLLLSDTLFWFLVLVAVALVVCRPESWPAMVIAGVALGAATLTRSVGLPLLVVFGVYLLVRRRWRVALIMAGACLAPMLAYMVWFHGTWGTYALTNSDGIFLYGRTAAFADCEMIKPPASERELCPKKPVDERSASPNYIWHIRPLGDIPNYRKFTPERNAWAGDFARRAILAQPGAYLETGFADLVKTFAPARVVYPTRHDVELYEFPKHVPEQTRMDQHPLPGVTFGSAIGAYTGERHSDGVARMDAGAAAFLRGYQKVVYLPGPILGVILVGGAVGMVVRRRAAFGRLYWASGVRRDDGGGSFGRLDGASWDSQGSKRKTPLGEGSRRETPPGEGAKRETPLGEGATGFGGVPAAGLVWMCAVALLVVPPFTAAFDHRYVIPAVPLACLALGLAVCKKAGDREENRPVSEGFDLP